MLDEIAKQLRLSLGPLDRMLLVLKSGSRQTSSLLRLRCRTLEDVGYVLIENRRRLKNRGADNAGVFLNVRCEHLPRARQSEGDGSRPREQITNRAVSEFVE